MTVKNVEKLEKSRVALEIAVGELDKYVVSKVDGTGAVFAAYLFSIALFIYLTNVVSREDRINRRLTQKVALLEKRIGQLEAAAAPGEAGKEEGKAEGHE